MDKAQRIVKAIEKDLTNRCGLRQEWEQIDDTTKAEIRKTWILIIRDELSRKES